MAEQENLNTVARLWQLFEGLEWDQAGELLADDFVAEWPHSGERFEGREQFIAVNRYYPPPAAGWRLEVQRIIAAGDVVVAEVRIPHDNGVSHVASFAELSVGKIRRLTEYWVEAGSEQPPEWRAQLALQKEPPGTIDPRD